MKDKIKVLFLSDDFPPLSFGGAGISTFDLAHTMKQKGHDVFVVTTCRKESDAGEIDYKGLKVFRIASDYQERWRAYLGLNNPKVIRKLQSILEKIRPDVVHANNIHYYISYKSLKVAKKYARALVFTARDTMTFTYGKLETRKYLDQFDYRTTWLDHIKQARKRWNPFRNFIIRRYFKYVDKIFSVSVSLKKALEQNGFKNVQAIHTGARISDWQVSDGEIIDFKTKHNLTEKQVLLYSGRLSGSKGGHQAIRALGLITTEIPKVVLLVAGSVDSYANEMLAEAKKLNVDKNLVFTGWINRQDIKVVYAASDIVLMPSLYLDPFPRVNIEAMAARKPVVGTFYGGTPEIVEDGVTGYVVNPFNTEEFAKKTLDLLQNPEKSEDFGLAGENRIKTDFNLDSKVDQILSCYSDILKKTKKVCDLKS